MHWVPQLLTAVGEGNLKPGIISKTDGGAIGQDALVVSIIRPPAQLEHEVASSQICDERFQLPGMAATAVEISSEPWAHSGFAVIARLRNHDMKDAGVYSGVEIAVSDVLQFLKAPVILGEFWPTVGEALRPYSVLAAATGSPDGCVHLLLAELAVTHLLMGFLCQSAHIL